MLSSWSLSTSPAPPSEDAMTDFMLWSYDHPLFLVCLAVGGIGGLMLTRGVDDD